MQRAQHSKKKERRKRRVHEAAEPGTPPVYGTSWAVPHGLTWVYGRGVSHPRLLSAPVSSLLSQGRCDIADLRAK